MEAPTRARRRWRVILITTLLVAGVVAGGSAAFAGRTSLPVDGWDVIYQTNFNSVAGWTSAGEGLYSVSVSSGRTAVGVFACNSPRWFEGCVDGQWAAARRTIHIPSSVHPTGYEHCKITVSFRPTTGPYLASTGHRLNIEALNPSSWRYLRLTTHTITSTSWKTIETATFAARDFVVGLAVEQRPSLIDSYAAEFDDLVVSCYYFYYP